MRLGQNKSVIVKGER